MANVERRRGQCTAASDEAGRAMIGGGGGGRVTKGAGAGHAVDGDEERRGVVGSWGSGTQHTRTHVQHRTRNCVGRCGKWEAGS